MKTTIKKTVEPPHPPHRIITEEYKEAEKYCLGNYGFNIDENQPHWKNLKHLLTQEKSTIIKQYRECIGFHNLYATRSPQLGTSQLLGLGISFCIRSPIPSHDIDKTMSCL
mmetsp:Transcript_35422/g.82158  ORF Transcript_35422/g.82158 Transcript_35422/m.82158 type:complete len:111 (-) Transcript_35422:1249-1581(-)